MTHSHEEENYTEDYASEHEEAENTSDELTDLLDGDDDTNDEKSSGAARANKTSNRALIRKVAAKAEELAGAPAKDKALLAEILSSSSATADLTVAVILSSKSSLAVVADVKEVAEAKPMRAVMVATAAGKARQKALWSLLLHLGKVTGSLNASEAKAGFEIAEAVQELDKTQHASIDRAVALAAKR
jgi:hypothetical protein